MANTIRKIVCSDHAPINETGSLRIFSPQVVHNTVEFQMQPPNPQVYRLAAELVETQWRDYSCSAINKAFEILYPYPCGHIYESDYRVRLQEWVQLRAMYLRQYELMFGPESRREKAQHPFWDRLACYKGENLHEYRILALLTMADICENPA